MFEHGQEAHATAMSRTSIIALLIFGAVLGYFLSFGSETTRKFQASVYQLLAPFFTTGSGLQKQITSVRTGLKSLEELERENASLRLDNRQLRATNQALRDVEHEVNRLRHALNYRERSVFKLIPAEIVTRDSSTWWHTVTINRGKEDKIDSDMPVVTDEGLVGKTTTVSKTISVVLLVTDENCKVAASVEGTREQGIVSDENDFLFYFTSAGLGNADRGVLHSAARLDVQRAHLHRAGDCFLRRDGPA